jgi:HupE/UreJ protein
MSHRGRQRLVRLLALGATLAFARDTRAHTLSTSTSSWEIRLGARATARVDVRVPWLDLRAALPEEGGPSPVQGAPRPGTLPAVDRYLTQHVLLYAAGQPCRPSGPVVSVTSADPGQIGRSWNVVCEGSEPLEIRFEGLFEVSSSHLHLARAQVEGGPSVERVLVFESRRFPVAIPGSAAPTPGSGLFDYVRLGVAHIVTGVDHLAFLLALLLAGASVRQVATIVTGFTAAHSVTLGLGVLGVIRPDSAAIEALIGLSIVVVAFENFAETVGAPVRRRLVAVLALVLALSVLASLAGRFAVPAMALAGVSLFTFCYLGLLEEVTQPGSLRWFVAFVFGLVHGFGFAGALAETALPAGRLAHALLGFNVGVELGQLAIVVIAWPLLRLALRVRSGSQALLIQLGSAPVLAAGLYWFLSRGAR